MLSQHKENFKELDAAETQRMARGQKEQLDREVRKFRRRRLVKYHDLEQDLLREVSIAIKSNKIRKIIGVIYPEKILCMIDKL